MGDTELFFYAFRAMKPREGVHIEMGQLAMQTVLYMSFQGTLQ